MNTPQIHPLKRQGTHQRERLLQALIPANLKLDDRAIADLMALVGQLATHIRYWPDTNTLPADDEPNWEKFWQSDATPLLAILAATDLVALRSRYRTTELAYLKAEEDKANPTPVDAPKPDELMADLVEQLFGAARLTFDLYKKLPVSHPLKAEFGRLIGEKLAAPLRRVIAYHKGVSTVDLLGIYRAEKFIDTDQEKQPWGIGSVSEFRNAIKPQRPNNTDQEPLWRLFLAFYNVLSVMVAKAGKSFQFALQSRRDHPPHVALLLSFLHLFRHLQTDFNALPEKHLLFYYQDVLRLQQRGAIPDRVHLVFEMAQNIDRYRLSAGTEFRGGTDQLGQERLYALETETVISKAKLVEQKSIYFLKNSPPTPIVQAKNATGLSAKAEYEKLEGKIRRLEGISGIKLGGLNSTLGSFVSAPIQPTTLTEVQEQLIHWIEELQGYEARPGLLISSPELWMEQSDGRAILLTFDENTTLSSLPFSIQLSIEKAQNMIVDNEKWNRIESADNSKFNTFFASERNTETANPFASIWPSFFVNDNSVSIYLPPSFPALKPYTDKDNPLLAQLLHPFILIQPENPADYERFKDFTFNSVTLQTASVGIKKLTLQLGDVVYPANADIPLVGATAGEVNTFLYITTPELSQKRLTLTTDNLTLPKLEIGTEPSILKSPQILINGVWKAWPDDVRAISVAADSAAITGDTSVPAVAPTRLETVPNFRLASGPQHYPETSGQTFLRVKVVIPAPVDNLHPINTYKIAPESISLSYLSEPEKINVGTITQKSVHQLFHYHPFGGLSIVKKGTLAPKYEIPSFDKSLAQPTTAPAKEPKNADGNLLLGFEKVVPGQTLSVLFQMREGTGNPDKTPPEIVWSYYRNNVPVRLPLPYILSDGTDGLRRTEIIRFQIPADITDNISAVPGSTGRLDLFWLMASATEEPEKEIVIEALPLIDHIYAQAATVVFKNQKNTLEHLTNGLPANTIGQLRVRDVNVRKVTQPDKSVGGRLPENTDPMAYYRRISERLRHKQRAITVWDYERLTLEQFPSVAVVKCLTHTEKDDLNAPGFVTLAVIPDPDTLRGEGRFYPGVGAGDRTAIADYLNQHNSFFVSGVGGFSACCCHDHAEDLTVEKAPCGCPPDSRLQVVNAQFEPIRLQVCVRFYKGKDQTLYTKILNDDLRAFLAPWTRTGGPPIAFGTSLKTTQLLRFLENLDYVDVVMSIKVKHFASKEQMLSDEPTMPWQVSDELVPLTSRSVLTTYLNILDEAKENVLDHEINVIETNDPCECADCKESAVTAQTNNP
jgi:hypothetical protein